jgi:predicted ester cyclase
MSVDIEANKKIVLRYFLESHNAPYNLDVINETWSADAAEQRVNWQKMERDAFPDKHFAIEDIVAEDDKVVLRWTFHGTHKGDFWTPVGTAQATGNSVSISAMVLYRLKDGRIVSEDGVPDWLGLLRQFGAEVKLPTLAT